MPNIFRQLRQDYADLQKLFDDVNPPVQANQDWKGNVIARRSLEDGVQVELWYLAEHFLMAWNDWSGMWERYLAYFGQPAERIPRSWRRLLTRCNVLAGQMLRDERLDELVHKSWFMGPVISALLGEEQEPTPQAAYRLLVTNHRRIDLLLRGGGPAEETKQVSGRKPAWPRCMDEAVKSNTHAMRAWPNLPRRVREDCLWHLRQYGRANLLASWLVPTSHVATQNPSSALFHLLNQEATMHPTIEDFAWRLELDEQGRQMVHRVLHRVTTAVGEFGYDGFCEDVTSGDFIGGNESPVGSNAINTIPGKDRECRAIVLAVSRGNKKGAALSFGKIMTRVKAHLIECKDRTPVVIFLCDIWSPEILDEHIEELRAHHRQGVRFLFLLIGTPDRVLAPVAVDLAASL